MDVRRYRHSGPGELSTSRLRFRNKRSARWLNLLRRLLELSCCFAVVCRSQSQRMYFYRWRMMIVSQGQNRRLGVWCKLRNTCCNNYYIRYKFLMHALIFVNLDLVLLCNAIKICICKCQPSFVPYYLASCLMVPVRRIRFIFAGIF